MSIPTILPFAPTGAVTVRRVCPVKVLVVVEGSNDIEFLRRISKILHADDPPNIDMSELEQAGELLFVPVGGSDQRIWTTRLEPLRIPEFHLYDRDVPPLTEEHQAAVDEVNSRQGCIAALTTYRHVENYLHPEAIYQARDLRLEFTGEDDLAELAAKAIYEREGGWCAWQDIPQRKRRQMKHRAKRWLNTEAVDCMTPKLLDEQDPQGDVRAWLEAIDWLMRFHD